MEKSDKDIKIKVAKQKLIKRVVVSIVLLLSIDCYEYYGYKTKENTIDGTLKYTMTSTSYSDYEDGVILTGIQVYSSIRLFEDTNRIAVLVSSRSNNELYYNYDSILQGAVYNNNIYEVDMSDIDNKEFSTTSEKSDTDYSAISDITKDTYIDKSNKEEYTSRILKDSFGEVAGIMFTLIE